MDATNVCGRRVVIVGTSGSGKTTLARTLAQRLNVPHIELDALHWEPNWTATPPERLRQKVIAVMDDAPHGWVICGNYRGAVSDATRSRADTLIWLDYPMSVVCRRIVRRTVLRCWRREVLWGGCRESIWMQLCTKESIFLWVINTWRIRRRDYPRELRGEKCRHMRIIRLRSPRQADQWLARACATFTATASAAECSG